MRIKQSWRLFFKDKAVNSSLKTKRAVFSKTPRLSRELNLASSVTGHTAPCTLLLAMLSAPLAKACPEALFWSGHLSPEITEKAWDMLEELLCAQEEKLPLHRPPWGCLLRPSIYTTLQDVSELSAHPYNSPRSSQPSPTFHPLPFPRTTHTCSRKPQQIRAPLPSAFSTSAQEELAMGDPEQSRPASVLP